ncbi:spinster family MFS transporter [Aquimarina sp. 2304DJ70-9]|uniref:spinster family MFS transporter n=1 Tax=Aquimarina penaris TaxID=3231044 RepID=UPI003462C233
MSSSTSKHFTPAYRRYVLFTLTGVYAFNFIDRQVLVILQEPIKADLGLSDTQLGLLTGLAFAALYVILGLPIARYADKNNRKNVVSFSLIFWSAMTALSGMAQNFTHLLLARIGVGVGEAGGSPPAHSIISDYYEPEKRATALSIYSTGVYIGIGLGFIIGGLVAANYGWRIALLSLGIPGILYAILLYFTVKEPIKGLTDNNTSSKEDIPIRTVISTLFKSKTFVFVALASGLTAFGSYGIGNWLPPFLSRTHGMPLDKIGITLGLIAAFFGALGTFSGGYITDKFQTRGIKWYCWIPAIAIVISILTYFYIFFGENLNFVIGLLTVSYFLSGVYLGPAIAITHSLVPAKMRAFSSAVLFFILNALGLGLGPLVIGMLSDYLTPILGADALRWAFTVTFATSIISAILFYFASRHYEDEIIVMRS